MASQLIDNRDFIMTVLEVTPQVVSGRGLRIRGLTWSRIVLALLLVSKEGLDQASLKKGMRTMNQKASGKLERPRGEHASGAM